MILRLAIDTKDLVAEIQGKTMPNPLHLMFVLLKVRDVLEPKKFLGHIQSKHKKRERMKEDHFPYLGLQSSKVLM